MENNIPKNTVVLSLPEEGSAMSYFSKRKNMIDDQYLLISNIDTIYADSINTFRERFLTSALENLNYYGADYIILTEYNQLKSNITNLYFDDNKCIKRIYVEDPFYEYAPKIYQVNCVLTTS